MEYMCTKFGVDSSSRFPCRAWTNRRPTHTGVGGKDVVMGPFVAGCFSVMHLTDIHFFS